MPERIGFLGLGIMGSRMAANVRRAGFPLTVWTHTPGKAARWAAEHGARAVDTPAEVARASEIVVSMVVDGEQVASVLLGEEAVVDGAHDGLLCVDMSTIAPADTRRIGAALAERGVRMLDAPVTGSAPRAEAGTLTIMAGGEAEDFARARPLLEAMGERDRARRRARAGRDAEADQQLRGRRQRRRAGRGAAACERLRTSTSTPSRRCSPAAQAPPRSST